MDSPLQKKLDLADTKSASVEKKPDLKESVIEKIDAENVCPRGRWFFMCKETAVWVFWALSVVVGAFAVAVSLFVISHKQYSLYEATHDSFWTFFIGALPYIWILLFAITAYLAVRNLRHTKRGYRYCAWKVIVSSLVLSLAGGAVLQLFGFGYSIDHKLGKGMDMYMSQEKQEMKLWQAPEEGRLIGRQVLSTVAPTSTVIFEDSVGDRWSLDVSELQPMDLNLLEAGHKVRIVGTTSNIAIKQFHACGAFPWMLDRAMKMKELSAERQEFVNRVYKHKDRAKERLAELEQETFNADVQKRRDLMGPCAEIAPVRRIEAAM